MPPNTKLVSAAVAFSLFLPCFFVAAQGLWPGQIILTPGTWARDATPTRCAIALPDASRRELSSDKVIAALPVYALTIGSGLAALAIHLLQVGRDRAYYLWYTLYHLQILCWAVSGILYGMTGFELPFATVRVVCGIPSA
ncbi:hypothetical protein PG997_010708 [Apiospora hydei]|uniref:Uncharacterized protein n=1 Tax=Apiospora hydei TaxID=1337664 RepID=A0ABR1VJV6_9PEZI